jgi:hypothetical protein
VCSCRCSGWEGATGWVAAPEKRPLADTSQPPLRTITTDWEMFFPEEEVEVDGEYVVQYPSDTLDITVKLWYMPYGVEDESARLWREYSETVKFEATGW